MPGWSTSMTKNEMPLCLGTSGSVRTTRIPRSEYWARQFHTFWPLTIHSSPSRSARVCSAGQVAAGAGLGEELAPGLLAGGQRAQPALLLLVGAELDDHRGAHGLRLVVGSAAARRRARAPPPPPRPRRREAAAEAAHRPRRIAPAAVGQERPPLAQRRVEVPVLGQPGPTAARTAAASLAHLDGRDHVGSWQPAPSSPAGPGVIGRGSPRGRSPVVVGPLASPPPSRRQHPSAEALDGGDGTDLASRPARRQRPPGPGAPR